MAAEPSFSPEGPVGYHDSEPNAGTGTPPPGPRPVSLFQSPQEQHPHSSSVVMDRDSEVYHHALEGPAPVRGSASYDGGSMQHNPNRINGSSHDSAEWFRSAATVGGPSPSQEPRLGESPTSFTHEMNNVNRRLTPQHSISPANDSIGSCPEPSAPPAATAFKTPPKGGPSSRSVETLPTASMYLKYQKDEDYGPVELWKGKNYVFCGGKLVFGPDLARLCISTMMLLIPFGLFVGFLHRGLPTWLLAVACVIFTLTMISLFRCASTDPGIVQRRANRIDSAPILKAAVHPVTSEELPHLRYCYTCNLYRGPRTHHCSVCDNCVDVFDHHCPWTGSCVGAKNYDTFLHFVHGVNLTGLVLLFSTTYVVYNHSLEHNVEITDAFLEYYYIPMVLIVYGFLLCFPVSGLMLFHHYLMNQGQTTLEHIRGTFNRGAVNPFNQSCCRNYGRFLGKFDPAALTHCYTVATLEEVRKRKK